MSLPPDIITNYIDPYLPKKYIDRIRKIDEYKNVKKNYSHVVIDLDKICDIDELDNIIVRKIEFEYNISLFLDNIDYFKDITYLKINDYDDIPISSKLTKLKYLELYFDEDIIEDKKIIENINNLPPNITHLVIEGDIIQPLNKSNLPKNLLCLTIDSYEFNCKLDDLPSTLKYLNLRCRKYKHSLDNLPDGLKQLILTYYDNSIDNLPKSLKHLELSHKFNQSIDNLPNIKTLIITGSFNQPIQYLPNSLRILKISGKFNKFIDYLPDEIEEIYIDGWFDKPINKLPSSLKVLYISGDFNQPINNIPTSLTHLTIISNEYNQSTEFPKHLHLNISKK